ncbi:MAG TPA: hypothetical protein VGW57_15335 [Chthoniobacterales bacterium]|nr:hypothetical protein [Chthoniobacterales bacterium]
MQNASIPRPMQLIVEPGIVKRLQLHFQAAPKHLLLGHAAHLRDQMGPGRQRCGFEDHPNQENDGQH